MSFRIKVFGLNWKILFVKVNRFLLYPRQVGRKWTFTATTFRSTKLPCILFGGKIVSFHTRTDNVQEMADSTFKWRNYDKQ